MITSSPKGTLDETIITVEAVLNAVWRITPFETIIGDIAKSLKLEKTHQVFKEQQINKVHQVQVQILDEKAAKLE